MNAPTSKCSQIATPAKTVLYATAGYLPNLSKCAEPSRLIQREKDKLSWLAGQLTELVQQPI